MRWFKNVALATATTIIATPLMSTSCSCSQEKHLKSIDINIARDDYTIEYGNEETIEDPIEVFCYDQKNQIFDCKPNIVITNHDGSAPPDWIKINEKQQIHINAQGLPGTYKFHIYALDAETQIKSGTKCISVIITNNNLLPPDSIFLQCSSQTPIMYLEQTNGFSIDVEPNKAGVDKSLLSKECYWTVLKQTPAIVDDKEIYLFNVEESDHNCKIVLTQNLPVSCVGNYELLIRAISKLNNQASNEISLSITLKQGLTFYDETSKYLYTRPDLDSDWELSKIPEDVGALVDLKEEIDGVPVSKIGDFFCANSGITKISSVILPSCIKTIGEQAFVHQRYLYAISMPGVKLVKQEAFWNCKNMYFLEGGEPCLEQVDYRAFLYCENLEFKTKQQLKVIGSQSFVSNLTQEINLGPYVINIGYEPFDVCQKLKTIIVEAETPPTLSGPFGHQYFSLSAIKVPKKSIDLYKNSPNWSNYSGIIVSFD